MFRKSNQQKEEAVRAIADVFSACPDGDVVSWDRLHHESGVPMGPRDNGRSFARLALKRLKRSYETLRGEGVRLSHADNAITILGGRLIRIDGAVRRADRTQHQLATRHLEQMPEPDKQRMLVAAGFFGAIRAVASQYKSKLFKRGGESKP